MSDRIIDMDTCKKGSTTANNDTENMWEVNYKFEIPVVEITGFRKFWESCVNIGDLKLTRLFTASEMLL